MSDPNIGVHVHDLRSDPKAALQQAARIGFRSVELRTIGGSLDPRNLSDSGRRHLARYVCGLGLSMAALDADFGTRGLSDPGLSDQCVQKTAEVLALAREVGVRVVTGSLGRLDSIDDAHRGPLFEALRAIGERADTIGTTYAVATTLTSPQALRFLVEELDCPAIRICADPGAMVMSGFDPIAATELLADKVVLSHARDGLAGSADRAGREVPLGQGHVDWLRYLMTLQSADYPGPQILRRTDSQQPADDLARDRDALLEEMEIG